MSLAARLLMLFVTCLGRCQRLLAAAAAVDEDETRREEELCFDPISARLGAVRVLAIDLHGRSGQGERWRRPCPFLRAIFTVSLCLSLTSGRQNKQTVNLGLMIVCDDSSSPIVC